MYFWKLSNILLIEIFFSQMINFHTQYISICRLQSLVYLVYIYICVCVLSPALMLISTYLHSSMCHFKRGKKNNVESTARIDYVLRATTRLKEDNRKKNKSLFSRFLLFFFVFFCFLISFDFILQIRTLNLYLVDQFVVRTYAVRSTHTNLHVYLLTSDRHSKINRKKKNTHK